MKIDKWSNPLPNTHFLLITSASKASIISLDDIDLSDTNAIKDSIEKAISRYGDDNVRYCKVVSVSIEKVLKIDV